MENFLAARFEGKLLRNWQIWLALVLCFVEGSFFAQTETFLWWYLEEIGAGSAMRYTIQLTTVLLEACLMAYESMSRSHSKLQLTFSTASVQIKKI